MQRALELAVRGVGRVSPNPPVGAVIVKGQKVIGEGYHHFFGGPHAEVEAISSAYRNGNNVVSGATMYVTLEPCAHQGKTPPCVDLLIKEKIARVVIASQDPNSQVAGRSIKKLRESGVAVEIGVCRDEAVDLARAFFKNVRQKLPYTTLKLALSENGMLAGPDGKPQKITSPRQDHVVHRLRGQADAVMIGISTVLADDPALTVRHGPRRGKQLVRVVLDSDLRIPENSQLVRSACDTPLWVFCSNKASAQKMRSLERRGVIVHSVKPEVGGLDLRTVLKSLYQHDIGLLLIEGGSKLAKSILAQDLVDETYLFYGQKEIPGCTKHQWPTFKETLSSASGADLIPSLPPSLTPFSSCKQFTYVSRNRAFILR